MTIKPLSAMTAAATLTGTELLYLQQSGGDVKATTSQLISGTVKISSFGAKGDNSTDDATAFLAFRTAALAFNASNPNEGIVLELTPKGQYLCSNGFVFTGIDKLTVLGNNASLKNNNGTFNDAYISYYLGGYGYSNFTPATAITAGLSTNSTAYPIATAAIGATQVTCLTVGNAANMTVGNWALVGSNLCANGNPPGVRFFDYVKVLTVNAGTGVVTFDRALTNTYLSTLPTHGGVGVIQAAFIFPFLSIFGVRQKYVDLNILSSPASPTNNYIFMQGEYVEIRGGEFAGGIDPSQLINGSVTGARIAGVTAGAGFEIDHWVKSFAFRECDIFTQFDVNSKGSSIEITNCSGPGINQMGTSMRITGSKFGTLDLRKCLNGVFENNFPSTIQAWPTQAMSTIAIDGTTITYAAGVITIPQSSFNFASAGPNSVTQFLYDIWGGVVLDIVVTASGYTTYTGGLMKLISITDDATNVYLTVDVFSLQVTAAVVHSGSPGSGYVVNDSIVLSNGTTVKVATLSGSGVATVTITQAPSQQQLTTAVPQIFTTGVGSGATFDLTYGVPNGTLVAAPNMLNYSGKGNIGGDIFPFSATDSGNRVLSALPNGDMKTLSGNKRTALLAPVSGDTVNYVQQVSRGYLKQVTVNVLRAYTGAQYSVNTLFLIVTGYTPELFFPYIKINLSKTGQRQVTQFAITGSQTGDVANAYAFTQAFSSSYNVDIGGGTAFTDATALLPIVEVDIEFEDIVHNVPW